jgi:hypothetical protein
MSVSAINCQACNASLNLELARNGLVNCEYCGTSHNLSRELTLKVDLNNLQFAVVLCDTMIRNLSLVDLQDVVYSLSGYDNIVYYRLDWENLPGGSVKSSKCRELIAWCQRRDFLQELVEVLIVKRPMIITELV